MKPVIIYTMQRCHSTAALSACKRNIKYNEPFDLWRMLGVHPQVTAKMNYLELRKIAAEIECWDDMVADFTDPEAAIKAFGPAFFWFPRAIRWFEQVQQNNTHDIFVLYRPPREIFLSILIANRFGYAKPLEREHAPFRVDEMELTRIDMDIEHFLRYYPSIQTKAYRYNELPESHFDFTSITNQKQNSLDKLHFIENLDEVEEKIAICLEARREQWEDKTGTSIFA